MSQSGRNAILSLAFVVAGAVFILTDTFSEVEAEVWGVSSFLLVVCAAYGFCRMLPSKRRDQTQKALDLDHVSGQGATSAFPFHS